MTSGDTVVITGFIEKITDSFGDRRVLDVVWVLGITLHGAHELSNNPILPVDPE